MKRVLEADPPAGATVRFDSRTRRDRLERADDGAVARPRLDDASSRFYDKPAAAMGEGGTIPFMAMLGKHFPEAQFLITGVLGPAFQRARPERIPARAVREEADRLRGAA